VPGIHGMDSEKGFLDLWLSRMTARVSEPASTSVATPHCDHARKSLYARGGLGGPRERPCRPTPAPVLSFDGSSATPSLIRPHTRLRRTERMAPTRTRPEWTLTDFVRPLTTALLVRSDDSDILGIGSPGAVVDVSLVSTLS
jgi:hypothetical protein